MTHYFDTPFADSGDKTPIPIPAQPGGQVSYTEGYTVDYTLNQGTNPAAKDVPRQEHNQLSFVTTELLKEIQETGLLPYRADVNYLVFGYVGGSDGNLYKATATNGPVNVATGSVLSFSDNGAGGTTVTATAALPGTIIDGIDITISGTTNYNGTFIILNTASPSFDIPTAFVGDDATGTWDFTGVVNPVGDTSGIWVAPIIGGGVNPGDPTIAVSPDDTTLGNLEAKLVAGTNITLTTVNPGANETREVKLGDNPILGGTDSVQISGGTTAERNGTPVEGMLRKNTDTNVAEYYDGTDWKDLTAGAVDIQTLTSSGLWTKPASGSRVLVQIWAAGASGGCAGVGDYGGGGGGGAYSESWFNIADLSATETVTIGAGGAAITVGDTNGNAGGNTTFGSLLTIYGGAGGIGVTGTTGGGGGGGGLFSAGALGSGEIGGDGGDPLGGVYTGAPSDNNRDSVAGGGLGGRDTTNIAGMSVNGGGGGGAGDTSVGAGNPGGNSFNGGGGGGGADNTDPGAGGNSQLGGDGGAGALGAAAGTAGAQPGGGGGGSSQGDSGPGGDGECIVTVF